MPLMCDPESTFDYVLETDRQKPKEHRPVFVITYLSGRKWKEIARLNDDFDESDDSCAMLDMAYKMLKVGLVNWKNLTGPKGEVIPFDLDKLEDILTMNETIELMRAITSQGVTVDDKKKLESQSGSNTEQSAQVVQAPQSAKINRP